MVLRGAALAVATATHGLYLKRLGVIAMVVIGSGSATIGAAQRSWVRQFATTNRRMDNATDFPKEATEHEAALVAA